MNSKGNFGSKSLSGYHGAEVGPSSASVALASTTAAAASGTQEASTGGIFSLGGVFTSPRYQASEVPLG